jgi:exocyst complex component 6
VSSAAETFNVSLTRALDRLTKVIGSKLDEFFELSEYDWEPTQREAAPSMYLYELVNWLTTVLDSLPVKESHKNEAYRGAVAYIAECLTV